VEAPELLQDDLRDRTQGDSICIKKIMGGVSISLKNNKEFNFIYIPANAQVLKHTLSYTIH
jgi:hypothetical protein